MFVEPKSIIPFISSEEGLVTKFTVTLEKPLPLEEVIGICGSGKGKRITNDPAADDSTEPTERKSLSVLIDGQVYVPFTEMKTEPEQSLIG